MSGPFEDICALTEALYQSELNKMSALNAQETALRRDLAQLDEMRRENQTLPEADLQGVRQIGADVLWQGWVSRKREELNIQLAQVLAQKERMKVMLRQAFGKKLASRELHDKAQSDEQKARSKKAWQTREDLQLLKAWES